MRVRYGEGGAMESGNSKIRQLQNLCEAAGSLEITISYVKLREIS